jgi:hypothetical protein
LQEARRETVKHCLQLTIQLVVHGGDNVGGCEGGFPNVALMEDKKSMMKFAYVIYCCCTAILVLLQVLDRKEGYCWTCRVQRMSVADTLEEEERTEGFPLLLLD